MLFCIQILERLKVRAAHFITGIFVLQGCAGQKPTATIELSFVSSQTTEKNI